MNRKREAYEEALAQFWFNGLIEPARDANGHVRLRNGEIVWEVTYKGASYAGQHGLDDALARLRVPGPPRRSV
jgi:hypothetical protein